MDNFFINMSTNVQIWFKDWYHILALVLAIIGLLILIFKKIIITKVLKKDYAEKINMIFKVISFFIILIACILAIII